MVLDRILPDIGIYIQLVRFLIVAALGVVLTRIVLMPVTYELVFRTRKDKVSAHSIENLAGVLGLVFSLIIGLQAAGFGGLVTILGAITAALTVAIGFGMRDQVSNIVGGFFIYSDSPFVKGDYIKVDDQEGVVKEISLRQTVLKGSSSEKNVIPNSLLTLNPVKNFSKGNKTKISVQAYLEPEKVPLFKQKAIKAVEDNDEVLKSPKPEVKLRNVEEGKIEAELLFWISESRDSKDVKSNVIEELAEETELFENKGE